MRPLNAAPQAPHRTAQELAAISHAPTMQLYAPPPPMNTTTEIDRQIRDLAAQIEQLRNDFFSAATNISALSDRTERLESRPHSSAASGCQAEVAALRSDIEQWISQHMETAVEHCMRRVWARAAMPPSAP